MCDEKDYSVHSSWDKILNTPSCIYVVTKDLGGQNWLVCPFLMYSKDHLYSLFTEGHLPLDIIQRFKLKKITYYHWISNIFKMTNNVKRKLLKTCSRNWAVEKMKMPRNIHSNISFRMSRNLFNSNLLCLCQINIWVPCLPPSYP